MSDQSKNALEPMAATPEGSKLPVREPLARRILGNYVFQSMNWGIRLVEQLLLIPLFMAVWSADLYKDWLVVSSMVFFLARCTFGIDDYFGNCLLRLASVRDEAGFTRELQKALFVACTIAATAAVLVYSILLVAPIARALSLSSMDARTAILIIVIMTPVWTGHPILILHAVYRAHGEFSRGECIYGIYMSVQLASLVTTLALGLPPLVIASCFSISWVLTAAFITVDVSRRYPGVVLDFIVPHRGEWPRIAQQSLLYFTNPLSAALTQYGTLMVLGFFGIDAATTIAFNIFRVLTGLTRQLGVASFAVGSSVEMARQYAAGDLQWCHRLYTNSGRVVSCLAGILSGLTICVSAPFVRLWTHGTVSDDQGLVICFLAGIFLAAPGRVSLMLLSFTNQAFALALASCAYSIGGLALGMLLVRPLGGLGLALAFAVTEALSIGLYAPLAVGKLFRFGALRHIASSAAAGLLAFAASYLGGSVLFENPDTGIAGLTIRLVAWSVLILPIGGLCALPSSQRARVASFCSIFWRRTVRSSRSA